MRIISARLLFLLTAAMLAGCGGAEDDGKSSVKGTVNWNGAPLPAGQVMLGSANGDIDAAEVTEGKFTIRTKPGEKTVSIRAQKSASFKSDDPRAGDEDVMYQYIPEKFNNNTELKETVSEGSPLAIDISGEEIPAPKK